MSPSLALVLLGFVVESVDLLLLGVADDLSTFYSRAIHEGDPTFMSAPVADHQHFAELYLSARLAFQLLYDQGLVLLCSKLFSTLFGRLTYNCS